MSFEAVPAEQYEKQATKVRKALVGCTTSDAIAVLTIVLCDVIENFIPEKSHSDAAHGVATSIIANFPTKDEKFLPPSTSSH